MTSTDTCINDYTACIYHNQSIGHYSGIPGQSSGFCMHANMFSWLQDQMALCGCNHRFVTVSSDKKVMATSETAKEKEMIKVRMLTTRASQVHT